MKTFTSQIFMFLILATWFNFFSLQSNAQSFSHPATGLVVTGDVMHAQSGSNFIGVVYSRTGNVYYNQVNQAGVWGEETLLGTGSEARLAIDSNNHPHVVFTAATSPTKIACFKFDGSNWSEVVYIESNNAGACSKPDVAVDGSGFAHVTYTDTQGNTHWYQNKPDIMYATNNSGNFIKSVIFDGFYESLGGADYYGNYFDKGSFIDLDLYGNYFIAAHQYIYNKNMTYIDRYYSVVVKSNLGTGETSSASSDGYAIYDLDFNGTSIIALYKENTYKTSELTESGTTISFTNNQDITATSVSSACGNGANLVIGGKAGTNNLFTKFDNLGHVYIDVVVKNTVVSTVDVGGVFYAVYTDNGDGKIKIREVAEPLSITQFGVPGQDGPTVIDGQAGTVDVKVVAGTSLSNLVATYSTTADVTGTSVETVPQTSGVTANNFTTPLTYVLSDGTSSRNWQVSVSVGILDTIEVEICDGETYSFNSNDYSETGNYTETFTATNGSDSTVLLILTVNPLYNHTDQAGICQGESFAFGSQTLTTSGVYTETFETIHGCDSTVTLTLTVHPGYNLPDPESHVAYYPFDGDANDVSGNGLNGTVNGATLTDDRNGNPNSAYFFNGYAGQNGIDVEHSDELNMNGPFSISLWLKPEIAQDALILGKSNFTLTTNYWVRISSDGNIFWDYNGIQATTTNPLQPNNWYHIVLTANNPGGEKNIFINGQLISGTSSYPTNMDFGNVTTRLTIGYASYYSDFFKGAIDEIRIFGKELTESEIAILYDESFLVKNAEICAGDSYSFGGTGYTEAGEYEHTFTSINGCDSTVTLILTVNPVYSHTEQATICEGDSYTFGTETLTTAGEYEKTFSSIHGCDSTVTLTLTVNPMYNHTKQASICQGESYPFGTETLTTSGEYEKTFTSINGCDSTVTLTLTVNPVYNHTVQASICEGESYPFGTEALTTSGEYEKTFTSIHGCDSTVTLTLTVNPVFNHAAQASICQGESYTFGTETLTTAGEYEKTFSSIHGCDSTVTLTLTVNPVYTHIKQAGICEGGSYSFGTETLTTAGEYEKTFSSINGCDSTVTLILSVYSTYNNPVSDCDVLTTTENDYSETSNLLANVHAEYGEEFSLADWNDLLAIDDIDAWIACKGLQYQDYFWILNNGQHFLDGTRHYFVQYYPGGAPGFFSVHAEIGNKLFLGSWYGLQMPILTKNNNPSAKVQVCSNELPYHFGTQWLTEPGQYTEVFQTIHGCDSTVTITLSVNPVYNHTDVASICQGESFRFGTQTLTMAGEYEEIFSSITGCDSTVTLTLTVNPVYNTTKSLTVYEDDLPLQFGLQSLTAAGTFTETFSTAAGCDSTVTLTLTVKPADITPPVVVCNPISVSLNSSGQYALTDDDIRDIAQGSTDNDSEYEDLILAVVPAEFSCNQAGTNVPVMVVVTDLRANSDTCYTTVQVSDAIQPEITCRNTTLTLDDYGLATLNISDVYSSATDGCGIQLVTASKTTFNCQDLGSQIIQVTATDNNNNSQTCNATVYVNDYLSPVFESVGNQVVTAADGACTASIIYPRIYASDNCGSVDIQHFEGLGENGIFPAGITVERWVAIDGSGNSDTLRFEIQVLTNPAKPGFDTLAVVETLEDSDWISVHLTHVYDGLDCEDSSLEFSLQLENELLFDRHQFNYITGKDSALLELLPAPDAFGETKAVITVRNAETNLEHSDTLTLRITPVNDPPFVVRPLEDLQTRAGDTLKMLLVPEQGYYFDDVDDETLQLSLKMSNGENIPGWLQFRNDSILAFPAIADTGCINLILVAADFAGEEVHSPFVFCIGFPVGNQLFDSQKLKVYPNPTTGKVYVDFLNFTGEKINISVVNYLGQEVLQKIYQCEERLEIDLTGKSSGMYIIRAKGKDLDANFRIILKSLK